MSSIEMRTQVHQMIDALDDSFLEVVYSMLGTYQRQQNDPIIGYDLEGNALHASAAKEEYAKRVAAMKAGQKTTIEELRKESSKW